MFNPVCSAPTTGVVDLPSKQFCLCSRLETLASTARRQINEPSGIQQCQQQQQLSLTHSLLSAWVFFWPLAVWRCRCFYHRQQTARRRLGQDTTRCRFDDMLTLLQHEFWQTKAQATLSGLQTKDVIRDRFGLFSLLLVSSTWSLHTTRFGDGFGTCPTHPHHQISYCNFSWDLPRKPKTQLGRKPFKSNSLWHSNIQHLQNTTLHLCSQTMTTSRRFLQWAHVELESLAMRSENACLVQVVQTCLTLQLSYLGLFLGCPWREGKR